MKLKKLIALSCCAAIGFTVLTACGDKGNKESNDNMKNNVLCEENVKLLGRTYMIDDTLWLSLSGSGVDFSYTGKKLSMTVVGDGASTISGNDTNYARLAVYVDGERVIDDMINSPEKSYTIFESDKEKTVSVQIIKLSETAMSTLGIKPLELGEGGKLSPAPEKTHKIEFIGDSITCGYGVDDEDPNHNFSTATEDVTKAYAYKTAQKLNADYSMFSTSGYGIISGYTSNDEKVTQQTIPQYYESMGFSWNSFNNMLRPQDAEWDFSRYQPDLVVINLGTNDDSYCKSNGERQEEYSSAYVAFLKKVRKNNPTAHIICSVGIMGTRIYPAVEMAVYSYTKETGDENITAFKFEQQDGENDGLAADWHPTEATHEKASDKLVEYIRTVMSW